MPCWKIVATCVSVVVVFKPFFEVEVIASTAAVAVAIVAIVGLTIAVTAVVAGISVCAPVVVGITVHVAVVAEVAAVAVVVVVVVVAIATVVVGVVFIQLLEWLLHVPRQLLAMLVHLLLCLKQPIPNLLQHVVVVRRFAPRIRRFALLNGICQVRQTPCGSFHGGFLRIHSLSSILRGVLAFLAQSFCCLKMRDYTRKVLVRLRQCLQALICFIIRLRLVYYHEYLVDNDVVRYGVACLG